MLYNFRKDNLIFFFIGFTTSLFINRILKKKNELNLIIEKEEIDSLNEIEKEENEKEENEKEENEKEEIDSLNEIEPLNEITKKTLLINKKTDELNNIIGNLISSKSQIMKFKNHILKKDFESNNKILSQNKESIEDNNFLKPNNISFIEKKNLQSPNENWSSYE